ncbi:MAG: hypothetical protein OEL53_12240 [Rhodospirillales bacterium]|nr:hypothetical protein [Rhodospirillales bacterium]
MTHLFRNSHYFLIEAFQLLGKRLFGPEWQEDELNAPRLEAPHIVAAQRAPLEAEIAELDNLVSGIDQSISRNIDMKAIEAFQEERANHFARRQEIIASLRNVYVTDLSYQSRHAAYVRRTETETRLFDALRSDNILSNILGGIVLNGSHWQNRPGYRHIIDLSLIVLPKLVYSKRRGTVLLPMAAFDAWLDTVMPIVINPASPPSPDLLCAQFLRRVFAQGEPYAYQKKQGFRAAARQAVPGLSDRAFNRAWGNTAPDSFKKGGRK